MKIRNFLILLVLAIATGLMLASCGSNPRVPPRFNNGDMVQTKFGDSVIITDTSWMINYHDGEYRAKNKNGDEITVKDIELK
jgi:major membrane immunogen (membrane-anchored lipoprotein)